MKTQCPKIEHALLIISKKWNARIVQYLLTEPARFSQIENAIGISAKMLCVRLNELEKENIIEKINYSYHDCYSLTKKGYAMHNIITAICEWAHQDH